MDILPTNAQIEADVEEHLKAVKNLKVEDLLQGYRQLLLLNGFLRRSLIEAAGMAKVVYLGPKGYFEEKANVR
jgi:hypothetical protein